MVKDITNHCIYQDNTNTTNHKKNFKTIQKTKHITKILIIQKHFTTHMNVIQNKKKSLNTLRY